ncbi:hypothetical protein [Sphingomonas sp.]|uniref:hypothetical protein n=1 Tax=Sphingomonas sp. TaxID=28214 RepID=UPI000DB76214|nr:hypothetical protein [Sphingomonas sp.]PZU08257.1 MAG: hypothetical protein DI605_13580 [Sphingomonas sp.]
MIAIAALLAAGAMPDVRGPLYQTVPPMHHTIETRIVPLLDALSTEVAAQGRALRINGKTAFNPDDKFLPGKLAIGLVYPLLEGPRTGPDFERRLAAYRALMADTVNDTNKEWGIYYYLLAIYKLKQAGLLERAIAPETLAKLRARLDWRTFVRQDDLTLINLPNNYYGVAFSCARIRFLLGWEDERGSQALMARTLDHYHRYSDKYGFADETEGEGRFDRYSVLLSGEIAQRFIETGLTPPEEVRTWLKASATMLLARLNLRGEGFEYGRSLGPYGETAFVEVLSAAAKLGLLAKDDEEAAYAFSSRVAARYMDFWYDPKRQTVNMWYDGRATDAYRGDHRILGENLSLTRQLLYTDAIWTSLGYGRDAGDARYTAWLAKQPRVTTTWFARGDYDRVAIAIRDGAHVIGLPLVNGAESYHRRNAYYPAPFLHGLFAGAPDQTWPNLVPRIELADGTPLMPLAYFRGVQISTKGTTTTLTFHQDALDDVSGPNPRADTRITIRTRFILSPGRIERTDEVTPAAGTTLKTVAIEFGSFDRLSGKGQSFSSGGTIQRIETSGYGSCAGANVRDDPAYHTPAGPLETSVRCTRPLADGKPLTLRWVVTYR